MSFLKPTVTPAIFMLLLTGLLITGCGKQANFSEGISSETSAPESGNADHVKADYARPAHEAEEYVRHDPQSPRKKSGDGAAADESAIKEMPSSGSEVAKLQIAPSSVPSPHSQLKPAGQTSPQLSSRSLENLVPNRNEEFNTEAYDKIQENEFQLALDKPLSTFSVDVDTASYANVRRFLTQNSWPAPGAVRIEEMINYFDYDYAPPADDKPFAVHAEVATCPWNPNRGVVRIGLKGKEIEFEERPSSNLVFLLDVSGSMNRPNKLPLVKKAMRLLVDNLEENDRVAIVVYAGAAGLVLPSTTGDQKQAILSQLDNLQAGGSTNGGKGIHLAYNIAVQNFIKGGINRVILCTDGDFNVGTTNQSELVNLIESKAKSGVFLSVLGFGQGNLKDSTMEKLADKGNGNYGYIDTINEAKKLLVDEISGTLITIAKDVKIQVDFNPAKVFAYRLIGYENRMLQAKDFLDDKKDAGEIGAGHTVTALYEIVPVGKEATLPKVVASKYKTAGKVSEEAKESPELLTVRLRYKQPDAEKSTGFNVPLIDKAYSFDAASRDFQFACAVAEFGMLLRHSEHKDRSTFENVRAVAHSNKGDDLHGYRAEFIQLVDRATQLAGE